MPNGMDGYTHTCDGLDRCRHAYMLDGMDRIDSCIHGG